MCTFLGIASGCIDEDRSVIPVWDIWLHHACFGARERVITRLSCRRILDHAPPRSCVKCVSTCPQTCAGVGWLHLSFYLRRSRQVLELCKLLLLGLLLLWGGAVCMSPSTLPYFSTINLLLGWDPSENGSQPVSSPMTSALWILFRVGSSPLELPVIIKKSDWISE